MLRLLVLLNPRLLKYTFDIQEKSLKFNQSVYHVQIYSLTFKKPVFYSGVNGIISIELNIDYTNISFGLMFVKTNVQNYIVLKCAKICFFKRTY